MFILALALAMRLAAFASPATLLWAHDWNLQYYAGALNHISNLLGQRVQRSAGRRTDIETLRAAHQCGLVCTSEVVYAALSGSVLKLAWLCNEQRCALPATIMDAAHNIPMLQFLMDEGCDWHDRICGAAAGAGDLEQLKWLHQHGATLHRLTALDAARSGDVSIFEWLQQQQQQQQQCFHLSCNVMKEAAHYGHLPLCKWLRSAGCPWDDSACGVAVHGGFLDVLRFLHENGCPWDERLILYNAVTATYSDTNVLQYLWEQGLQLNAAKLTEYLSYAGSNNKRESAKWLREKSAQWPDVLQDPDGIIWEDNRMVEWARAEGCTAPVGVMYTGDY
jgi:hypothetical protein